MPDFEYPHLEETLPGFHEARDIIKANDGSLDSFQFKGSKFDFYRFVNRLRLATNFKGVEIEGYHDTTEESYGALHKLFLSWSAFEMYCHLCDSPYHAMFFNYPKRHTHALANDYWDLDQDGILIDFLIERSSMHGQDYFLKQFDDGNNLRAITVAACIRHIYAHGHLTAHPQGLSAEVTQSICELFGKFIRVFVRSDFERRLELAQS